MIPRPGKDMACRSCCIVASRLVASCCSGSSQSCKKQNHCLSRAGDELQEQNRSLSRAGGELHDRNEITCVKALTYYIEYLVRSQANVANSCASKTCSLIYCTCIALAAKTHMQRIFIGGCVFEAETSMIIASNA